ncbi:MAG: DUF948 domain-containing protein [Deltaproteobacteria bacterium]|nr:DUF948 domain-containing protein [Deltaproteobacteria bacterium]
MTFTVTIAELSIFLAAIAFFILVIYLIPAIIQLRNTAKAVEDLSQRGKEAMEDISSLVKKLNGQAEDIGGVVKKVTDVGLKAAHLADIVVNQLKGPIITVTSIIAGIEFGLKHFKKKEGDKDVRK